MVFQEEIHRNMKSHLLIIVTVFLISCRYKQVKERAPRVNTVNAGEKFMINLPENHNDGYTWQLQQSYNTEVVNTVNEVWHGNDKGLDVNLWAVAAGQTTLTFVKRKYRDTSEIRQYIVKITPP
jgi:predicted secreted protein